MEGEYYHGLTELGVGEHDKIKKRLDAERRGEYDDQTADKEMSEGSSKNQRGCDSPAKMSEGEYYHGRTELGIGEHDTIKKRLEEERHAEYQDHMAHRDSDAATKMSDLTKNHDAGSIRDVGFEMSHTMSQQRKHLSEERKADYMAHMAAHPTSTQKERQDESYADSQSKGWPNDESTNSRHVSARGDAQTPEAWKQKNLDYGQALREQIADNKRTSEQSRKDENEADQKDLEITHGYPNTFDYGSQNQNNTSQ